MKRLVVSILLVVAALPVLAQSPKATLADLIESGNRKAALDRIRADVGAAGLADINEAQPDGTRPIQWAIHRVDYELLAALLAKRATVNFKNEFGSTPIAQAAALADARMVKMLLDAGAEPEGANTDGQTALMVAIKTGETSIVEVLIKAGANVNTIEKFHKQTPLMWAAAASRNAGDMVKLLLARGANVKPRELYTDWPSQITSEPRAQYRPVGGLTAMLYAAREGCYACVDALIAAGADVNIPTPEGVTALMLALDNDHNDVAKLLLDRGSNPKVWDAWGRTALYIAVDRKECARGTGGNCGQVLPPSPTVSSMDIINRLLAAGVEINAQLNMERPSRSGSSGRFIDPQLGIGCTPLLRATIGTPISDPPLNNKPPVAGDAEVVRVLLDKGANPNINDMGLTPFLVAAGVGPRHVGGTGLAGQYSFGGPVSMELMELLLQHGADVNAPVTGTKTYSMRISRAPSLNEGRTALHIAAQEGKVDLVRYLLSKGANPEIKDAGGLKALDLIGTGTPVKTPTPADLAAVRSILEGSAAKR